MKIRISNPQVDQSVTYEGLLDVTLSKVFNGVLIRTEEGDEFGVALRDTGLEIKCPDGTVIGVMLCRTYVKIPTPGASLDLKVGDVFVERNGKVIG